MNENRPKLMHLSSDGQAQKPEGLEGQTITILDRLEVDTRDGRLADQWVVRLEDGTTSIYWAAGKGPTLAVRQWFRDAPRTPLHCRLFRQQDQWGNNVWSITEADDGEKSQSVDDQLKEVGI